MIVSELNGVTPTYRGVSVQVCAEVLDLELKLLLCPVGGALSDVLALCLAPV